MLRPMAKRGPCSSLRRPWAAGLIQRCWRLGGAAVCCAPEHVCVEVLRWVSVTAAAILMLAPGTTTIRRSFLVTLLALQAPSSDLSWIGDITWGDYGHLVRGDYGRWVAFISLLLCLLYFIPPGELALPLSTILLVMTSPDQFRDMRESQGGAMLSAAIAIYLTFQHFNGAGSLRNAFRRASIVTTFSIICMTIVTLMLAF